MIGHISELQREVMWEPKLCYISYVQLSIISLPCPLSVFLDSDLTSTHHTGIAKKKNESVFGPPPLPSPLMTMTVYWAEK